MEEIEKREKIRRGKEGEMRGKMGEEEKRRGREVSSGQPCTMCMHAQQSAHNQPGCMVQWGVRAMGMEQQANCMHVEQEQKSSEGFLGKKDLDFFFFCLNLTFGQNMV